MVKPNCKGSVELFRYADDAVICCQYNEDAQRIRKVLAKRLEKFKLQINEEKTKLVAFDKQKAAQGEVQETFDFLGLTHICARDRNGAFQVKRQTTAKRMRIRLAAIKLELRKRRHRPVRGSADRQSGATAEP
jgi:hypothetical protein